MKLFSSRRILLSASLAVAVLHGVQLSAHAGLIYVTTADYTGSRQLNSPNAANDGLTMNGSWNDQFLIDWKITYDVPSGKYTYTYHLADSYNSTTGVYAALNQGLSHWNLQVSNDTDGVAKFLASDILAGSTTPSDGPKLFVPDAPGTGDQPSQPQTFYAIKYGTAIETILITYRAPVWGSFYAKDGNGGPSGATNGWNTGFTATSTRPADGTTVFTNWIPVPDGIQGPPVDPSLDTAAPEPASLAIWGLFGLAGVAYRRRVNAAAKG